MCSRVEHVFPTPGVCHTSMARSEEWVQSCGMEHESPRHVDELQLECSHREPKQ